MGKKYYWIKLKNDFFDKKGMKALRNLAGGDTLTIIYLKILLYVADKDGIIQFEGYGKNMAEEIALSIDEESDHVEELLIYMNAKGWSEKLDNQNLFIIHSDDMVGSETAGAQRVREFRRRESEVKALQSNKSVTPMKRRERERDRDRDRDRKEPLSGKPDGVATIIEYLNKKTGSHFRNIKSNARLIDARLSDYSIDEVKKVIDLKVSEWSHDARMSKYLRPETLFNATKFESYLNQKSGSKETAIDYDAEIKKALKQEEKNERRKITDDTKF
jgi:predicted phage replisome organizer/uncharacterized phage protein (TIGR02220 family)